MMYNKLFYINFKVNVLIYRNVLNFDIDQCMPQKIFWIFCPKYKALTWPRVPSHSVPCFEHRLAPTLAATTTLDRLHLDLIPQAALQTGTRGQAHHQVLNRVLFQDHHRLQAILQT